MKKRWYLFAKHISAKKERPDRFLLRLWHAEDQDAMDRRSWDRELSALNVAAVEELIRVFPEPWRLGRQLFDDSGAMRVQPEERGPQDTDEVLILNFLDRMTSGLRSASLWLIGPEPDELDALLAPWVARHAVPEAEPKKAE